MSRRLRTHCNRRLGRKGRQPIAALETVRSAELYQSHIVIHFQLEHFQYRCIVDCGETLRQTGKGEIVWGRSAAQGAAGP
jgi:hypothetical protein